MLPAFLVGVSHSTNKAKIQIHSTKSYRANLYSALIGHSTHDKTIAIEYIRNALQAVEQFQNININETSIFSHNPTSDSQYIYEQLEKYSKIIGMILYVIF